VEPEGAARRGRPDARLRFETDQYAAVGRRERGGASLAARVEAEDVLVERDRAVEVADHQPHRSQARGVGEPVGRGRDAPARVSHCHHPLCLNTYRAEILPGSVFPVEVAVSANSTGKTEPGRVFRRLAVAHGPEQADERLQTPLVD